MSLVIPVFIPHRGCPHDCLFCNQQKISGESGQGCDPGEVPAIIEEWLPRNRNRSKVQVAFFGGSFTCLPQVEMLAYLSVVQPYIRSGAVDAIRLSTRPDCISQQIIQTLKEYNVGVVELGVQSLNDAVLKRSLRGHNSAHSERALSLLKNAEIDVGLQLMAGLPGETSYSFVKGVKKVCTLAPDFVRLYPVLVVKDSGLENLYLKREFIPLSLKKAVAIAVKTLELLSAAGINIVRMGLQPSEELKESVIAGPYHPAFGELVRSRLWLKRIRAQCTGLKDSQSLAVHISHREVSAVVGHKKENIKRLQRLGYSGRVQIVAEKELPRGTVHYVVS